MTLILSNEDVERALVMAEFIPVLEDAYVELSEGRGANGPRAELITPTTQRPDGFYSLKSMDGVMPKFGIGAVRINSDILTYAEIDGVKRRDKMPAAPGGRWVGLVLLFSTHDGAPLAICPDGVMQKIRVGATSAIAARRLARPDSRIVALIGAGAQAETQLQGLDVLYDLVDIRVFSPRRDSRERFARMMSAMLGKEVRPCDSGAAACRGADIVACCTNSLGPVFVKPWLEPGMYVSSIKPGGVEIERSAWASFDLMAVLNHADHAVSVHSHGLKTADDHGAGMPADLATLPEILTGRRPGRTQAGQTTCFVNNLGMGYQFAVAGHVVLERARALGLGRELPTEWFTESVVP